jgi:hypothetical protein
MSASDLGCERGPMPGRAARPAALVVALPASLPIAITSAQADVLVNHDVRLPLHTGAGVQSLLSKSSIPDRTLTRAARFSPTRRAKIAPPTLSQIHMGEGAAAEVACSKFWGRAPRPPSLVTMVAQSAERPSRQATTPSLVRESRIPSKDQTPGRFSLGRGEGGGPSCARDFRSL